jgi:hypothetical protein
MRTGEQLSEFHRRSEEIASASKTEERERERENKQEQTNSEHQALGGGGLSERRKWKRHQNREYEESTGAECDFGHKNFVPNEQLLCVLGSNLWVQSMFCSE